MSREFHTGEGQFSNARPFVAWRLKDAEASGDIGSASEDGPFRHKWLVRDS
jgi:hypothetical protein